MRGFFRRRLASTLLACGAGLALATTVLAQQKSPANAPAPPRNSPQKRAPANTPPAQQAAVSSTTKHPLESLKVEGNQKLAAEKIVAISGLTVGQLVATEDFDAARQRL